MFTYFKKMIEAYGITETGDFTTDLLQLLKHDKNVYEIALSLPDFSGVTTDIFSLIKPHLSAETTVLDYGSGAGHLARRILTETPSNVISVEIDRKLRKHQTREIKAHLSTPDRLKVSRNLAFSSAHDIDVLVLAALMLPLDALVKAIDIVKPGGMVILTDHIESPTAEAISGIKAHYQDLGLALKLYKHDTKAMRAYKARIDDVLFPAIEASTKIHKPPSGWQHRKMKHDNIIMAFEKSVHRAP
tara:strand:- start:7918 stop:8652 length:735 start_codon:yes stop_codon:yes gene_type:complete